MTKPEGQPPLGRLIATGTDWRVTEYVCNAGPDDRPFEEQHDGVTIAAVMEGSFKYRTNSGECLAHPGGFILGEAGSCYECGHEHGRGDHCLSFTFSPAYFDEIAHGVVRSARYAFTVPGLPAAAGLLPLAARIATLDVSDRLAVEGVAVQIAFAAVTAASGQPSGRMRISARDEKRVASVMRYIDKHPLDRLDLDHLAAIATVSKFHFLRLFARVAGVSPYRYSINARLRHAAVQLATSNWRISDIAYDTGFTDLSTFNAQFKGAFGTSPSGWRRDRQVPAANTGPDPA